MQKNIEQLGAHNNVFSSSVISFIPDVRAILLRITGQVPGPGLLPCWYTGAGKLFLVREQLITHIRLQHLALIFFTPHLYPRSSNNQ
jgi:hypothetical protein